jgi:hypothetical protein
MFRKCFELDKVIMDKSCILVEIKNKWNLILFYVSVWSSSLSAKKKKMKHDKIFETRRTQICSYFDEDISSFLCSCPLYLTLF